MRLTTVGHPRWISRGKLFARGIFRAPRQSRIRSRHFSQESSIVGPSPARRKIQMARRKQIYPLLPVRRRALGLSFVQPHFVACQRIHVIANKLMTRPLALLSLLLRPARRKLARLTLRIATDTPIPEDALLSRRRSTPRIRRFFFICKLSRDFYENKF